MLELDNMFEGSFEEDDYKEEPQFISAYEEGTQSSPKKQVRRNNIRLNFESGMETFGRAGHNKRTKPSEPDFNQVEQHQQDEFDSELQFIDPIPVNLERGSIDEDTKSIATLRDYKQHSKNLLDPKPHYKSS